MFPSMQKATFYVAIILKLLLFFYKIGLQFLKVLLKKFLLFSIKKIAATPADVTAIFQ
jgi:hypothetical protein